MFRAWSDMQRGCTMSFFTVVCPDLLCTLRGKEGRHGCFAASTVPNLAFLKHHRECDLVSRSHTKDKIHFKGRWDVQ